MMYSRTTQPLTGRTTQIASIHSLTTVTLATKTITETMTYDHSHTYRAGTLCC